MPKDSKVYAAQESTEVDDLKHKLALLTAEKNEIEVQKQLFELENAGLKATVSKLNGDEEQIPEQGLNLLPKKLPEIVPAEEKAESPHAVTRPDTQKLMQRVVIASTAVKPALKNKEDVFAQVPSYILHQNHPYKVRWDVLLAAMIIYSVITVPLRIAFGTEARGAMMAIDIAIDMFFFADICASFRTTYIDPETHEYVSDPGKIARHYTTSWFTIDFVSTLPIDRIAVAVSGGAGGGNLRIIKLIRVLRLVRLLKLMKLMKFGDILDQYENYLPVSRGVLHIFGMLIQITFVAHLMGCVWYALGAMECYGDVSDPSSKNQGCSWLKVYFGDTWNKGICQDPNSDDDARLTFVNALGEPDTNAEACVDKGFEWTYAVPLERRYTAAIYWAVTTMATVGYGDINTQNDKERAFAVFAMCVGASAFGYTIGIISDLVQNSDIVAVEKKNKMNNFVNYSMSLRLPYKLHKRIKKHWAYLCVKEGVFPQDEMLSYMPLELQLGTIKTKGGAYRELCLQVPGLLTKGPHGMRSAKFVLTVIPKLVPLYCKGGEILFEESMVGWHVYWVISGDIKMKVMVDGVKVFWKEVGPGSRFGENFVTDGTVSAYSATAIEDVPGDDIEMTSLDREDVQDLTMIYPELLDELRQGAIVCSRELTAFKSGAKAHASAANAPDEATSEISHTTAHAPLTDKDVDADREKGIFHNMSAGQLWTDNKMVHPEMMRKIQWDLFIGFLILWSVVIVPMRIAFNVEPVGNMLIFDFFIDISFSIDLFMSFRTAYFTSHRELIYDNKRVYKHYLMGWFGVDFVTTFPIDRVAAAFVSNPSKLRSIKMLRVLRLARLAKIAKILQNGPMFELFEDITAGINPSIFRLMMLFLQMFFCAHMIGCVWHYVCNFGDAKNTWVGSYYLGDDDDSVTELAWDDESLHPTPFPTFITAEPTSSPTQEPTHDIEFKPFTNVDLKSRYLTSVYWALATMTTVGYGDISPNSMKESEMVVAMLSMLFGTTIFAYVIGEVVMAVLNFNPAEKELARKKRSLKKYIEHHKLAPKGVGIQADEEPDLDHVESAEMAARKGLLHYVEMTSVFNTHSLFKRTPEFLQRQIITFHYQGVVSDSGMLKKLDHMFPGLLARIFPILHPVLVSPDVDIVTKGDRISSMFFLQEGECRVREHETYLNPDVSASERDGTRLGALAAQIGPASAVMVRDDSDVFQNRKKYDFVSGDYFMEHAVFIPDGSHCRAQLSVRAAGPNKTKLLELKRKDFLKLADICPVAFEFLKSKWNHPNDEWTVWTLPPDLNAPIAPPKATSED